MNGPAHYEQAELLITETCEFGCPHSGCVHVMKYVAEAQVHATLALAAATALAAFSLRDADEWLVIAGVTP